MGQLDQTQGLEMTINHSVSLQIGSHLSPSGGFRGMVRTMDEIKANTFQYFSRNPRGSQKRADNPEDIAAYLSLKAERGLGPILAHAPYTLNAASAKDYVRDFAKLVLAEDLKSMEFIPGNYYNFHPGSHVGQGVEEGIRLIAETLNQVIDQNLSTKILLETMAGKGTEIGRSFEEIAAIIELVDHHEVLGVCLDTCHVHDAGYDIVNQLDSVLEEFDQLIGLDRLYAIHLNDSKNPFGSRKDRHEKIGEGTLGLETFARIVNHPALKSLPMFLETPNDLAGYAEEIELLRGLQLRSESEFL